MMKLRSLVLMVVAIGSMVAVISPVPASWRSRCCDEKCSGCSKCRCKRCCNCQEPPRGEVAFAIPGVFRPGQAVSIDESLIGRAYRNEIRQTKIEKPTRTESNLTPIDDSDKSLEDRVSALDKDVKEIKANLNKLADQVNKIADRVQ